MPRPRTKEDLMIAAKENYDKLNVLIAKLSDEELNTPFDFSSDEKKKEAHWKRDKNLRDILIHLYEWHQLLLNWVDTNLKGVAKPFNTSLEDAKEMFHKSHKDILELAERFTNKELFSKDVYKWVGGSVLGSYFVSTTSSHYDWAMKKLKAHQKNCKKK